MRSIQQIPFRCQENKLRTQPETSRTTTNISIKHQHSPPTSPFNLRTMAALKLAICYVIGKWELTTMGVGAKSRTLLWNQIHQNNQHNALFYRSYFVKTNNNEVILFCHDYPFDTSFSLENSQQYVKPISTLLSFLWAAEEKNFYLHSQSFPNTENNFQFNLCQIMTIFIAYLMILNEKCRLTVKCNANVIINR